MINPLAFAIILIGVALLLIGIRLMVNQRKTIGIVVSSLGVFAIAIPFIVTFRLAYP